jgi:hypothetical protein
VFSNGSTITTSLPDALCPKQIAEYSASNRAIASRLKNLIEVVRIN